jgi:flagellar motor switch protein FliM
MSIERVLSQDEIDGVFKKLQAKAEAIDPSKQAVLYDFRRPDRIAKEQLRAIHMLHENFARSLASSLSAYLRAYVMVNLVSVEQLSFLEFSQCLPSPTIITSLSMKPYDGNAVLEMNPSLVFPVLEMLLGGSAKIPLSRIDREITEIEHSVLDNIYRIVLNDMRDAWGGVADIDFSIGSRETEPQMLQILAPNEAVVAISMDVRIGDNNGMMNIGVPSIIIKMLRQKFDQQWSVRKTESTLTEQERIFRLIRPAAIALDARLEGASLTAQNLLELHEGDTIVLDHSVQRPLTLKVNGIPKFYGHVVQKDHARAIELLEPVGIHDDE